MVITLMWNGQPIPNLPATGTKKAIAALGLDAVSTDKLWSLWCVLDAFIEETDLHWAIGIEAQEIADIMANCWMEDLMHNRPDDYDWSAIPEWIRANAHKISTTASPLPA
jgi:hypothetical protein